MFGQPFEFSVVAVGLPPMSYQWLKNGVPLTNGGNISGATDATLLINPVTFDDAGQYAAEIANSCGSITTDPASLSVTFQDGLLSRRSFASDRISAVLDKWGPCPPPPTACSADVDHNGVVNIDDLLAVVTHWSA